MAGGLEGAWFVITYFHFPIPSCVLVYHELLRCFFLVFWWLRVGKTSGLEPSVMI